ncbi:MULTISPECIES: GNAT family N-acetyltransferase [Glaesserella]|uniref:N-acetyltransferase n=1 Tax=Glaesserella australis TaxID=2094024 RepID=A0A328BZ80_9PAST|nr:MULTISPECIES: GNAT family N-acetyltransferase [Glaesserella]AUI66470.1 N-acetyltransferase [Glaesserella sp. 15-184]RAL18392.1 N-acetyltransferase [Glaesserella australis]
MFRLAKENELPRILEIYNQVIERRTVTADLEPATTSSRQDWFEHHLNHPKYPIWVYELEGEIVAWCSYSQFYTRKAYDGTAEISFYLDKAVHGKGIGKQCVNFLIEQMPNHQLHTLLAFVFGNNEQSLGLLNKMGFEVWGKLPQVADMETHFEDLVMLGFKNETLINCLRKK